MSLTRLSITPSNAALRDSVSAVLFEAGAQGLQEDGEALVTVLDAHGASALLDAFVTAVRAVDPAGVVDIDVLPDVDWSVAWRSRITAHDLGAITIAPPWLAAPLDPARTVVIEPEMAFGTGEHETTRCVVRLMPGVIRDGDAVADLGAGSAVLAIAAAKLGARRIAAIELDHDAIANAEQNVAANGVADRVTVIEGDAAVLLPLVAPVRVVLANILSSVIIELLPIIGAAIPAGGAAIFSGILVAERDGVLAALEAEGGWTLAAETSEGEWWAGVVQRSGTGRGLGA
ncbi:MAG TPA: 50S ribosomal protein L11 methyltransferase [Gemmatimonadaceae bacterium]|jgi:ribosomal protein L11 methyltransferase